MTDPPGPPPRMRLPPEIVAVLRRNAEEITASHVRTEDGRCRCCAQKWQHTAAWWPCPPVKIAAKFLRLTNAPA